MDNLTEGIIIKSFSSGSSNLVIRLISSQDGKLTVYAPYAKNSKKRFRGLDIFDWGKLSYKASKNEKLPILESFTNISSFPRLRENLDKLNIASFLAEIFDIFTPENDPQSEQNFTLLKASLQKIEAAEDTNTCLKNLHICLFNLLQASGLSPNNEIELPSPKNLKKLIKILEEQAGKKLWGKEQVLEVVSVQPKNTICESK